MHPPGATNWYKYMKAHRSGLIYIVWRFCSKNNNLIKIRTDDTCWASSQLLCCLYMRTNFISLNEKNEPFPGATQLLGRIQISVCPAWSSRQPVFTGSQCKIVIFMFSLSLFSVLPSAEQKERKKKKKKKKEFAKSHLVQSFHFFSDFGIKRSLFF